VFESEVVPLLAADDRRVLEARTILGELNRRYPGGFSARPDSAVRITAGQGSVFSPGTSTGREAAYDFTNCDELGVTICSAPFAHLLLEL
jgi:hypothetical protein